MVFRISLNCSRKYRWYHGILQCYMYIYQVDINTGSKRYDTIWILLIPVLNLGTRTTLVPFPPVSILPLANEGSYSEYMHAGYSAADAWRKSLTCLTGNMYSMMRRGSRPTGSIGATSTVEVHIPNTSVGSVIGKGGSNIAHIRQVCFFHFLRDKRG